MKKIFQYLLNNQLLINMVLILIFSVGLFSATKVGKEAFPSVEMNRMVVVVLYPGASPLDVERNAVIPVEEELEQITGIDEYTSVATEDGARIQITLDDKVENVQAVKDEVYRKMSNVPNLPDEVDDITVVDMNPKLMSVYTIGVSLKEGAKEGRKELYKYVDQLEAQLRKLNNVSDVRKEGYVDPEIHIFVDPEKSQQKYISLTDVVNSIKMQNVRSTGGSLQATQKEQSIVTIGQFQKFKDVGDVIIRSNFGAKRVYIRDIARVEEGFKDRDVDIRINKTEGVTLSIVKRENADITVTVDQIKAFLEKSKKYEPEYIDVVKISDMSLSIRSLLRVVMINLIIGFFLVYIVLLIFLDRHSATWTAVGMPVVFLISLIYMFASGITFNMISLGALIMLLGIVVDDGIVVSENIYHFRQQGQSAIDATVNGLKEIIGPVVVAITTTIVAFLPMLFLSGMMGKMIHEFPLVVIVALAASLFEAIFILPGHLIFSKKKSFENKKTNWFDPIVEKYSNLLAKLLKKRYWVILGSVVLFVLSILLFSEGIKNFVVLTDDSADTIIVNFELPDDTSRDKTIVVSGEIETILIEQTTDQERIAVQSAIGHHNDRPINTEGYHDNWAQVSLVLVPSNDRKRKADQIIRAIRQAFPEDLKKQFTMLEIKKEVIGPDLGKGVELRIIGNDEALSLACAEEAKRLLKIMPGVEDIEDDYDSGVEELHVVFDQVKMASRGLNVSSIAQAIRTAYEGSIATYVQTKDKRYDFRVEVDPKFKVNKSFLLELLVPNNQGNMIAVKQVATLEQTEGLASISRFNGERTITVSAEIDNTKNSSKKVMQELKKGLSGSNDKYNTLSIKYGGEMEETMSSMRDLMISFIFALLAIYCVLVMLFRSPVQPFLIIAILPFGLVGSFLAFHLHGMPLSFMGMIGIIGLCGVLVNDSVIMVDFINKVIAGSKKMVKADLIKHIVQGAKRRLRPVLLTTVTTVVGLLPTIYGIGGSSEMIRPIVVALGYGVLFGTVITLIILPALYMISWDLGLMKAIQKKNEV
ncbi:efflux RND transporter permease subunit [bacterium]|nr:efflux RND transporter permease subunit [bacterium]